VSASAPALALALALALLGACHGSSPPLTSCRDNLAGVWRADATAPSGDPVRLHILDRGARLEAYPIFDDSVVAAGDAKPTTPDAIIAAPRAFDFIRGGDTLDGTASRRFQRGPRLCTLRAPARLSACSGDHATLDLTPLLAPTDWDRCTAPLAAPERWRLTRD